MTTKVNQLIQVLARLQDVSYVDPYAARRHHANADAALLLIFHIGREQIPFTIEQKAAVARKLPSALVHIQINIEGHGFEYTRRLNTLILKKRSALQFLVDTYGSFTIPSGPSTQLSQVFEQRNLKETIGILNEIIAQFHNDSDSDGALSDPDSDGAHSDRDFPGIPSSHYWWL